MIERPTVLILGAGASSHVGYPLGQQIIANICGRLSREWGPDLEAHFPREDVGNLAWALSESAYTSIDMFLERNPEMGDLGKFLIAECLKACEVHNKLFPPGDPGWYQFLADRLLGASPDDLKGSKLSIVTFNYDRSVEHYLTRATMRRYKLSEQEAVLQLATMKIIHPYGVLGEYPAAPYSAKVDLVELRRISGKIKIIHEVADAGDRFCSTEFEQAHAVLKESRAVFFMGFGFHLDNIRRLRFFSPEAFEGKEVRSTAYDLAPKEIVRLLKTLGEAGFQRDHFSPSGSNCNLFFRNDADLE